MKHSMFTDEQIIGILKGQENDFEVGSTAYHNSGRCCCGRCIGAKLQFASHI